MPRGFSEGAVLEALKKTTRDLRPDGLCYDGGSNRVLHAYKPHTSTLGLRSILVQEGFFISSACVTTLYELQWLISVELRTPVEVGSVYSMT